MIASLSGQIQAVRDSSLIVQVAGVGYDVHVPQTARSQVRVGQTIDLWTHLHVRENELALYGFLHVEEHDLFALLLGVNRIGPRTALAIVSTFAPETLRQAVAQGDLAALARIPGVGPKTAQRLLLDLKDKIGVSAEGAVAGPLSPLDVDVINALTALGYSVVEARTALGAIPPETTTLDERILAALRAMAAG
ncbi:MAG: Holliday junction branch migration protein RuvA [Chloroflexota bacterium]